MHTENYLESLKQSYTVAAITEVQLYFFGADVAYVLHYFSLPSHSVNVPCRCVKNLL